MDLTNIINLPYNLATSLIQSTLMTLKNIPDTIYQSLEAYGLKGFYPKNTGIGRNVSQLSRMAWNLKPEKQRTGKIPRESRDLLKYGNR